MVSTEDPDKAKALDPKDPEHPQWQRIRRYKAVAFYLGAFSFAAEVAAGLYVYVSSGTLDAGISTLMLVSGGLITGIIGIRSLDAHKRNGV